MMRIGGKAASLHLPFGIKSRILYFIIFELKEMYKKIYIFCFCPNTFADFVSVMVINSSQLQGEQSRDNYKMGQFYLV